MQPSLFVVITSAELEMPKVNIRKTDKNIYHSFLRQEKKEMSSLQLISFKCYRTLKYILQPRQKICQNKTGFIKFV